MRKSAGILPYRWKDGELQVFLVHPGGPFWKNKDVHAWSVAKGEFNDDEPAFDAALREFSEETGFTAAGSFLELDPVKQPGGKTVFVWAVEADFNPEAINSNTFSLEWPPRSGKTIEVPEIDSAGWFTVSAAEKKIHKGLIPLLGNLSRITSTDSHSGDEV